MNSCDAFEKLVVKEKQDLKEKQTFCFALQWQSWGSLGTLEATRKLKAWRALLISEVQQAGKLFIQYVYWILWGTLTMLQMILAIIRIGQICYCRASIYCCWRYVSLLSEGWTVSPVITQDKRTEDSNKYRKLRCSAAPETPCWMKQSWSWANVAGSKLP